MALSAIRSKYETAGFLTWFSILNPFHRHLFAQFINHYNEKYYSCFVFGKINIKNAKKAENSCMSVDPWALTICMKIWWNFFVKWYWCFFHTENRKGMKPDTYNPNKRKFCSFRYQEEKGNTSDPESVIRNHITRMNGPPRILPRITGLSKQMASALYFPSGIEDRAIRLGKHV